MPHEEKKECRECEYFIPMQTGIVGAVVGECRRFPPLLIVGPIDQQGRAEMIVRWPPVQGAKSFYCFEFKKKIRPGDIIEVAPAEKPSALDRLYEAIKRLSDQVAEWDRDHRPAG